MTYVFTRPQAMTTAATDVAGIGSAIRKANAAAAGSTTSVVAAAQDEVSAAISALFGSYGQEYQALGARVAAFHERFVQALSNGGVMYAATEAASASPLRDDLSSDARELLMRVQTTDPKTLIREGIDLRRIVLSQLPGDPVLAPRPTGAVNANARPYYGLRKIVSDVEATEQTLVLDVETQVATDEGILLGLKKEGE